MAKRKTKPRPVTSDSNPAEPPSNSTCIESIPNVEIIELQPEDTDPLLGLSTDDPEMLCGTGFFDDILSNESLYSSYLNGQITFDDLMRELHRKEPSDTTNRLADDISTNSDEEDSAASNDSDDPEFVPPRRLQRKLNRRRGRRGGSITTSGGETTSTVNVDTPAVAPKRMRRGSLPLEWNHYLGEAERFLNNGQFDEAEEICRNVISQAFRGDRQDASIRQRLIDYLERAGHRREALFHRLSSLSQTPESTGSDQFRVARNLADEFFKLMDPNSAIRAYEAAFEKFPKSGTESDKNSLLSILMQGEKYKEALKFFITYCEVNLMTSNRKRLDPNSITASSDQIQQFIRLPHILKQLTNDLAEKHYDWILDIIKAYRKIGMNSVALQLLTRLSTFESTKSTPLVWTLLAESQIEAGQIDDALDSYRHVVEEVAPRHADARLAYGNLLKRIGKDKEALAVLHPSSVVELPSGSQKQRKVRFADAQTNKATTSNASYTRVESPHSSTRSRRKSTTRDETDLGTETEWDEEDVEVDDEDEVDEEDEEADGDEDDEETSPSAQARADAEWLESSGAIPDAALLAHDPVAYRIAFERCLTRFLESMRLRNRLMDRLSADTSATGSDPNTLPPVVERKVSGFDIWGLFLRLIDVLQSRLPRSLSFMESATAWACLLPQIHSEEGRRRAASNLLISTCLLGGHGSPAVIKLRELCNRATSSALAEEGVCCAGCAMCWTDSCSS
ncbi:unnamed protein product [Echinostoma caproni]|uniref:TPR_REGION domain-containing protein n=1 Tax=Echinostoma caproni TaxID=27848 RepID=A0A183ANJ9_9TREM|nr:unnamed protein product [Echinostoma caproni]